MPDFDRNARSRGPYWVLGFVVVAFCGWYSFDSYLSQPLYQTVRFLYFGSIIVVGIIVTCLGVWRFDPARAKISMPKYMMLVVPTCAVVFGIALGALLTTLELTAARMTATQRQQYQTSVLVTKGSRGCGWYLQVFEPAIDRNIRICGAGRGTSRPKSGLEWTVTQDVGTLGLNVVSLTPSGNPSGTVHMGLW